MWRTRFLLGALVCVSLMLAMSANANIVVDEDFDQGTVFTNHGYNALRMELTSASQAAIDARQGLNVEWSNTLNNSSILAVVTNTGTASTEAYFSSPNSLKLASGQSAVMSWTGATTTNNWARYYNNFYQFAVRTTTAALAAVSPGTTIGHFKIDFSTDGYTNLTTEATVQFDFRSKSATAAEVVYQGQSLGNILPYSGWWTVVSIINHPRPNYAAAWGALDWVHGTIPSNPRIKGEVQLPWVVGNTTTTRVRDGLTVYVNGNTPATVLSTQSITVTPGAPGFGQLAEKTAVNGFEIAAENGGTIYVDDMFMSCDTAEADVASFPKHQAARMLTFTGSEVEEPIYPLPAAVKNWSLY